MGTGNWKPPFIKYCREIIVAVQNPLTDAKIRHQNYNDEQGICWVLSSHKVLTDYKRKTASSQCRTLAGATSTKWLKLTSPVIRTIKFMYFPVWGIRKGTSSLLGYTEVTRLEPKVACHLNTMWDPGLDPEPRKRHKWDNWQNSNKFCRLVSDILYQY